ncbi:MAG TPA: winged helix-turn-helix transcriptional regulator [Nitrososphaera sp.]|nr:winged helix-turn-helix transcriptional regulator [Nitrososphaera sp.]
MTAHLAKWKMVHMLAQTYALEILEAVSKNPLRFTDLENYSPNERTRSQRLKELEHAGLITTTSLKINMRSFVHYTATNKGRRVLQKTKELADMI